jgi:hypothetical protein
MDCFIPFQVAVVLLVALPQLVPPWGVGVETALIIALLGAQPVVPLSKPGLVRIFTLAPKAVPDDRIKMKDRKVEKSTKRP